MGAHQSNEFSPILEIINKNPYAYLPHDKYMHRDISNNTILIYACKHDKSLPVIENLLTTFRVDVNAKNMYGEDAMYWAIKNQNIRTICLLYKYGATISQLTLGILLRFINGFLLYDYLYLCIYNELLAKVDNNLTSLELVNYMVECINLKTFEVLCTKIDKDIDFFSLDIDMLKTEEIKTCFINIIKTHLDKYRTMKYLAEIGMDVYASLILSYC
jgi:hypothetical protein